MPKIYVHSAHILELPQNIEYKLGDTYLKNEGEREH